MRGSRKFCQRESNSNNVFFSFDEGREDPNSTKRILMAFCWRADDGLTLNVAL